MFSASKTAAPSGGYTIQRSVRLRASASAYFNRTPVSAGNQQRWTWSAWVKRGTLGAYQTLFGQGTGTLASGYGFIRFDNNDVITIAASPDGGTSSISWSSTPVYRDPSSWYHIVAVLDTTQATASNRFILYVNGISQTGTFAATPTLNANIQINRAAAHQIGVANAGSLQFYYDGYLTEVNFIDGQALTPSSFGAYNSYGVWQPIRYSGTYGTNGFYLNFQDNSAATAAAIGKDYSGNGNNWTPNNISVTAGVTYDSMLDVPTLNSVTNANFPTINPLDVQNASSVAQGNQYISFSAVNYGHSRATQAIPDGSYWEVVSGGSNWLMLGVANSTAYSSFNWAGSWAIYQADGRVYNNGAAITGVLSTFTTNDVIGFAVKGNKLYIAKNGTWLNSGDPVAQTGFVASGISSEVFPYIGNGGGAAGTPSAYFNAGQRPFTYTPPTGYKTINTYNLPAPTIANGANQFAATTYTGTGSSLAIANTVNSVSFQPDFVWVKGRSGATDHALYDSVRGTTKQLESNTTTAETTEATGLTAFGTGGFTVGALAQMNTNTATYVGWQWKAGGTAVTNTSGSITSQVSANTTAGFSIVTYTGTGANATVGHGLGIAPRMIIIKGRSTVSNWPVYHIGQNATPQNGQIFLDVTNAYAVAATIWNNTAPTSSVFSLGTNTNANTVSQTYVAYCWTAIAGYSAFGSYTGNGSADGPFVYLGFRPRYVCLKRVDSTGGWTVLDTSRSTYNVEVNRLNPNASAAESTGFNVLDGLSNGFKIRDTDPSWNASGGTYIYAAFAENPFNYSLAR